MHTALVAVGLGKEFPCYSVWNLVNWKSTYLEVSWEENNQYVKCDTVAEEPQ